MTNNYKFAGRVIEVNSLYDTVHAYCADYRTDETPEFSVTITQTDIDLERCKSADEDKHNSIAVREYPDSYLEELAVYRKIAEKMPEYDTILFHGSVIAVDGLAYLFTAKSGTGKSTHTRLWRELFGERAVMVNDDKPLLHIGDTVTAYGTPYDGKHRLSSNIAVPLKAVCILTRAADNHIEPITKAQAYTMLVQQAYRPADMSALQRTMTLIDKLADSVKLYRLGCNMDISAAQVAYNGMNDVNI